MGKNARQCGEEFVASRDILVAAKRTALVCECYKNTKIKSSPFNKVAKRAAVGEILVNNKLIKCFLCP